GLTRYDGTTFEILDVSLDYSFLWGSCMDESGDLWFGLDRRPGRPAGVVRWDGSDLELIEAEGSEGISIHSVARVSGLLMAIGHISYSVQGKKLLVLPWQLNDARALATVDDGTAIVAAEGGIYEVSATSVEKVSSEGGAESVVVRDGKIWASTSDGEIAEFDGQGYSQKRQSPITSLWRGVQIDSRGRLWVSGFGGGVCCYDDSILRLLETDEMPDSSVLAVEVDTDGTTWIGTTKGLWAVLADGRLLASPQGHGLSSASVTSLCATDGELWVGSRNGLVYSIQTMTIRSRDSPPELRGLSIAQIVAVDGTVYYRGRGPNSFGTLAPRLSQVQEIGEIPITAVTALSNRTGGGFWLALSGASSDSRIIGVLANGTIDAVLNCEHSTTTLYDSDDRLWIGGTNVLSTVDRACRTERVLGIVGMVSSIEEIESERILVGTEGGGLVCAVGETGTRLPFPLIPQYQAVNDISIDRQSRRAIIATNAGIAWFDYGQRPPVCKRVQIGSSYGYPACEEVVIEAGEDHWVQVSATSSKWNSRNLTIRWRIEGREWQVSDLKFRAKFDLLGAQHLSLQIRDPDHSYSAIRRIPVRVVEDARTIGYQDAIKSSKSNIAVYGDSEGTRILVRRAAVVARTDVPVLIMGESGTGKGVTARHIHEGSTRSDGPFIQLNCGGLSEGLVDSELFGHERGAFTGAIRSRAGAFELAHGGTLFLDEVGDLPHGCQARLLHVLQDGSMSRVGGEERQVVDVRVVSATNHVLSEKINEGTFREDLYYRLAAFTINVPPLRERLGDLPDLVMHFVEAAAIRTQKKKPTLSRELMAALEAHDWPGNIRELEHAILAAVVVADSVLEVHHLPVMGTGQAEVKDEFRLQTLDENQRAYIERVLVLTSGRVDGAEGAAAILNINPSTLRSRIRKLGVKAVRKTAK
ncbi:MAG: sigma 54-interacting transcriptional regulator, partial [Candidatus Latescibacteria bacterium]|nr:sigma 54-interacting transcriptional regulator [Candidatus Latescibacterota bacterium]